MIKKYIQYNFTSLQLIPKEFTEAIQVFISLNYHHLQLNNSLNNGLTLPSDHAVKP